jgi:hypothetical protein
MGNELMTLVNQAGLDKSKSKSILENFNGFFEIAAEWETKSKEIVVTDESQKDLMKQAREGRLFLKSKRVDVENKRKSLKEQSLREGQTIDSVARILKNLIEPIESHLENQEKFAEIREAQRKETLQAERIEILRPLNAPFQLYDLKNMAENDFNDLVNGLKSAIQTRIDAERKSEEERIARAKAEADERERIRVENEKLKAERAEQEKALAAERAKAESERKAAEDAARKEREIAEAKLREERIANEKLQAEIRVKAEAEQRAKRDAEFRAAAEEKARIAAERKAKRAPDKAKLMELARVVSLIQMPDVKSEEAEQVVKNVEMLLQKVVNFIHEKTENL